MTETCIKLLAQGFSNPECRGKQCGQYNLCHGIVTVHKPKQAVRKIE